MMKTIYGMLIIGVLTLTACEFPQQLGATDTNKPDKNARKIPSTPPAKDPTANNDIQLMAQYSQKELDGVSKFIEVQTAITMVQDSITKYPKQDIKSGYLYGGISLFTSTHSAYWYKNGTLYAASPYAYVYSPELPKAPGEVTELKIIASIEIGSDEQAIHKNQNTAQHHFDEFVGLVQYINSALLDTEASVTPYTTDFLDDLSMPLAPEDELKTIDQFHRLFRTVKNEQPETYNKLNIDQSLTLYTYGRIKEDMSAARVKRILGSEGEQLEESQKGNDTITLYAWHNPNASNIYLFFNNDKLSEKLLLGFN